MDSYPDPGFPRHEESNTMTQNVLTPLPSRDGDRQFPDASDRGRADQEVAPLPITQGQKRRRRVLQLLLRTLLGALLGAIVGGTLGMTCWGLLAVFAGAVIWIGTIGGAILGAACGAMYGTIGQLD
jgi:hypothetical protein